MYVGNMSDTHGNLEEICKVLRKLSDCVRLFVVNVTTILVSERCLTFVY